MHSTTNRGGESSVRQGLFSCMTNRHSSGPPWSGRDMTSSSPRKPSVVLNSGMKSLIFNLHLTPTSRLFQRLQISSRILRSWFSFTALIVSIGTSKEKYVDKVRFPFRPYLSTKIIIVSEKLRNSESEFRIL